MAAPAVGTRVHFVKTYDIGWYGLSARVVGVRVAVSRPFGTRTTLVDLRTDTGRTIQWPLAQVRRDTYQDGGR